MDEQFSAPDQSTTVGRPEDWIDDRPDVASRLHREPPDRVLVLGCGSGEEMISLATRFPNTTFYGVEADEAVVKVAKKHIEGSSVRDRVLCLQGSPLAPRMAMEFDVVIAVGLLTALGRRIDSTTRELLAALAKILGEEGLAIVDTPLPLSTDDVAEHGFRQLELLGQSVHGHPAYLLRR